MKESEWGYIWVKTHSKYIVEHTRLYERLQAHFRIYDDIHKGQLCVFRGYALDLNGQYKRPSTVESLFDKHKWFYNPFSFQIELLDQNTIDDFVEETPISKEMTNKMVRYHQDEDKVKQQKEKDDKWENTKEKWGTRFGTINDHFEKYQHFYRYGVIGGVLWLIGIIIAIILA